MTSYRPNLSSIFQNNLQLGQLDSDHTVYYWLFPFDAKGDVISSHDELESLLLQYMAHIHDSLNEYIWNNEPFSLKVQCKTSGQLGPHLVGQVVIGDDLEDEWVILFLLVSLTKAYPNLICRITDSDGEFPLIEAANHLPKWADPDTADQRVYIKGGQLHLIPPSVVSLAVSPPSVMEAVFAVNRKPSETLAAPSVQNAVKLRIDGYPRKISMHHHSTHAYVPVGVAALLAEYPTLVSAAVRAFCNRDSRDAKCLGIMRHFPPEIRVMTSVRFSKPLFALLSASPYVPEAATGWNIPSKNNGAHILGMKLACGFEILVCSAGGIKPSTAEDTLEEISLDSGDPKWIKYKESLAENGYFRGELEGSKLYRSLEANAMRYFWTNRLLQKRDDGDSLSFGSVVVKLLSKVNCDYEAFKKREKYLLPPDDEKWLEMTEESLDRLLEERFKAEEEEAPKTTSDEEMGRCLNDFLRQSSSYAGVEVPSDRKMSSVGPASRKISSRKASSNRKISSNSNASESSIMSNFSAKIDFNADSFTDALNNILEFSVPEDGYCQNDEDSSGMSSYSEDEDQDLSLSSRKASGESRASKSSSGVDTDARTDEEKGLRVPPPSGKRKEDLIPLATLDDDEFDTEDAARVDMEAVSKLLQTYSEEGGVGPASALFSSLKIRPSKH